jgi:hypothetical protein
MAFGRINYEREDRSEKHKEDGPYACVVPAELINLPGKNGIEIFLTVLFKGYDLPSTNKLLLPSVTSGMIAATVAGL